MVYNVSTQLGRYNTCCRDLVPTHACGSRINENRKRRDVLLKPGLHPTRLLPGKPGAQLGANVPLGRSSRLA